MLPLQSIILPFMYGFERRFWGKLKIYEHWDWNLIWDSKIIFQLEFKTCNCNKFNVGSYNLISSSSLRHATTEQNDLSLFFLHANIVSMLFLSCIFINNCCLSDRNEYYVIGDYETNALKLFPEHQGNINFNHLSVYVSGEMMQN